MPKSPESEILAKFFADMGEKCSEKMAKFFADFRPSISRTNFAQRPLLRISEKSTRINFGVWRLPLEVWGHPRGRKFVLLEGREAGMCRKVWRDFPDLGGVKNFVQQKVCALSPRSFVAFLIQ